MTLELTALVLLSAVLHPLWNAVLKKSGEPAAGFLVLTLMMVLLAGTHAIAMGDDLAAIVKVWPLLLISWGGQMFYRTGLVVTLRRGDLSAYYPIIRSSPVLIVLVGWLLLGERYAPILLAGIGLVLFGGFLLQYRPGVNLLDDRRTLATAIVAMCGTAVYSISDARAVQTVSPAVFFFWVEALCLPGYFVLFGCFDRAGWTRSILLESFRRPLPYLVAGVMCYASYWLILKAYALGGEVASVTSVRQASIPLSVLIGGFYLREAAMARRLGASLLLATGIVVIVLA